MEFEFDCSCDMKVSGFTRGDEFGDVLTMCDNCGAKYTITVTQIAKGASDHSLRE